jgi:hypothetical protein
MGSKAVSEIVFPEPLEFILNRQRKRGVKVWRVFSVTAAISWLVSFTFGVSMFLHFLWPATLSWNAAYTISGIGVLLLFLTIWIRKRSKERREARSDELPPKRGTWAVAAVGSFGIACLLLIAFEYASERKSVGREGHIAGTASSGQMLYRFQDFVPAFSDARAPYAVGDLPEKEREAKLQELESSGQFLRVLKGTRVQVVDREFLGPLYQVRFLDGPRKDGRAWVSGDELLLNP